MSVLSGQNEQAVPCNRLMHGINIASLHRLGQFVHVGSYRFTNPDVLAIDKIVFIYNSDNFFL